MATGAYGGFVLPSGKAVSRGAYVAAWRALRAMDPEEASQRYIRDWSDGHVTAGDVLRRLRAGMHDRINAHLPWYGRGRRWHWSWQRDAALVAGYVNASPRVVVRWCPADLRARLAHRLADPLDV